MEDGPALHEAERCRRNYESTRIHLAESSDESGAQCPAARVTRFMINRDYTKEVGLDSGVKRVPLPYVIALFALIALLGWFGLRHLSATSSKVPPTEQAPATEPAKVGGTKDAAPPLSQ
jgi:hypothetical protein